jgi:hypothetical protein
MKTRAWYRHELGLLPLYLFLQWPAAYIQDTAGNSAQESQVEAGEIIRTEADTCHVEIKIPRAKEKRPTEA